MQTDSELESDTSSINGDGAPPGSMANPSSMPSSLSKESLDKRIESLVQENRVLKMEIETFKLRVKSLQEENFMIRKASVNIQVLLIDLNYILYVSQIKCILKKS